MDTCKRTVRRMLGIFAATVAGLMLTATPASAQGTCIQDVWKAHGNKQNLTCSAQDVTLSQVTNINITAGGSCQNGVCRCFLGGNVTFTADFQMDLTADTRYDVGFYVSTDGGGADGALTGACSATQVTATNAPTTFKNLDAAPDTCGDITGPLGSAFNPQIVSHSVTMPCTDPDLNGQLELPWCTTWRQPGSNAACTQQSDAFPGSPSKCNCGTEPLDIFTETANIVVTKTASPTTVPETGGDVTYSVAVENKATQAPVTLDSLVDDIYGDITAVGGDIKETTCVPDANAATCEVGGTIAAGGTCTCTFKVAMPPADAGDSVTDTVDVCGTDSFGHSNLCNDDDATVTYTDVPQNPLLTKTALATACQIDATYQVVVSNNSAQDTLTLNTLTDDKFGSITTTHAAEGGFEEVRSTTCGQAGTGNPGVLPAVIAASGNYTCSFVGRITSCDLSHTNTATGTATDDDGASYDKDSGLSGSATVTIKVTN